MPTDARSRPSRCIPAAVFLLSLVLGGCAVPDPAGNRLRPEDGARAWQQATDAGRTLSGPAASHPEPRYLRFKPDDTQLLAALDDGRFTYLEFAVPVTAEVEFFDQDGRVLPNASAGRIAAIQGVHGGILVKRADRASFVSPNPRALSAPRPSLPETADHSEARAKLENLGGQMQAMLRAMEAARPGQAAGMETRTASSRPPGAASPWPASQGLPPPDTPEATPSPRTRQLVQLLRSLKGDPLAPPPVPLAGANASAAAPDRGLVRVFFATASRAIVAPDDGLSVLMREAGNADQIRVTGYTDATGSRAANDALALARADAVVQILLRRGIPAARIVSSAIGADDYIADNASDAGRALNRRVEVLLLKNGQPVAFVPDTRSVR